MTLHIKVTVVLLQLIVFLSGLSDFASFDVGKVVIVQKLKPQHDPQLNTLVLRMNNSWVRIIHREEKQGGRHEFTIQLLNDLSVRLRVPRKKLQNLSRIIVYDFSNSFLLMMNRKFMELIGTKYVMLPSMCQIRGNVKKSEILREPNVLFTRHWNVSSLRGVDLKRAINTIHDSIPQNISSSMIKSLLQWVHRMKDPYFLQLVDLNWNRFYGWDEVAIDGEKNIKFLKRMLDSYRITQQLRGETDWLRPLKRVVGYDILHQWLKVNDPRTFIHSQDVHVLWKWNDLGPGFDYVDMALSDVLPLERLNEQDGMVMNKLLGWRYSPWIYEVVSEHLFVINHSDAAEQVSLRQVTPQQCDETCHQRVWNALQDTWNHPSVVLPIWEREFCGRLISFPVTNMFCRLYQYLFS